MSILFHPRAKRDKQCGIFWDCVKGNGCIHCFCEAQDATQSLTSVPVAPSLTLFSNETLAEFLEKHEDPTGLDASRFMHVIRTMEQCVGPVDLSVKNTLAEWVWHPVKLPKRETFRAKEWVEELIFGRQGGPSDLAELNQWILFGCMYFERPDELKKVDLDFVFVRFYDWREEQSPFAGEIESFASVCLT